ncbi:hypothetical protein ALC62_02866 [Cyphomyrmex costatus]|uniref:MADF domain-containing protein n=1 Tax=Cyphomyrmex costatus TaxID=456900 RepID=A0A151IML5_9HYME|nr:hypothetical protein ALC62_02866 [Cyphomyrmex costatus]
MEDTSILENEDSLDVEFFTQNQKYGDDLLIDLIRSRPFLYDKKMKEYRDIQMKENAWAEISSILEVSVSDCQLRWLRLRQRFSKERQLRENETRSGAGKPKRQKWVLFDNLSFLEKIVTPRRTYSNVTEKVSSCMNTQSFVQKPAQNETYDEIHSDKANVREREIIIFKINYRSVYNKFNHYSVVATSVEIMPIPQINEPLTSAKTLNTPLSCFTETRRPSKRPKDAVETAFCQMNTTLNTVASKIVQNQNDSDIQDPDVIIGKLVTAELKRTMEPMKSTLKRKFLEIMYSHNE